MKTIAVRLFEQRGYKYELREYAVNEAELDAISVAKKVGMEPASVFKTLVARGDRSGILMACVAANADLDLKKLASVTGNKKVELVPVKEIQSLTGYVRGGVSPLGSKKKYPLFVDQSALNFERISVSAGMRGMQMIISPRDLAEASDARLVDIARTLEN
jgi:Cys-tRNA(Pro)/Cys-tRNA(Cys) deacylase